MQYKVFSLKNPQACYLRQRLDAKRASQAKTATPLSDLRDASERNHAIDLYGLGMKTVPYISTHAGIPFIYKAFL